MSLAPLIAPVSLHTDTVPGIEIENETGLEIVTLEIVMERVFELLRVARRVLFSLLSCPFRCIRVHSLSDSCIGTWPLQPVAVVPRSYQCLATLV